MVLLGGMWTLGLWVRKAVECFKCCLVGNTYRSMEDSAVECDLIYCGGLIREASGEMKFSMLPRNH